MRENYLNELILDNPILVKHVRSRLRKSQLVPALTITLALMGLIVWWGIATAGFGQPVVYLMTRVLQTIILVIVGATQVAGSVGGVRESNILDFHRISPLPPLATTVGFFLGAPIREYILFALTLPLGFYCMLRGFPEPAMFFQEVVLLVMVAWFFHGLALLSSLMAKKPKANAGGMLVVLFIVLWNLYGAFYRQLSALGGETTLPFFGVPLPWLLFAALYLLSGVTFFLIASTRKMRSERAHALSRPQATAFLLTVAVLMLGGFWTTRDIDVPLVLVVIYGLVLAGLVMAVTITPNANGYAKGLRRAERQGRKHLTAWDDLALNRVVLGVFCLIVLIGSTVAWDAIGGRAEGVGSGGRTSLAIAVGVLVVAYFGLAYQFFGLVAPKRPGSVMFLFLFFAWVVPLLAGAITSAASMSRTLTVVLMSLSPIAGLATSAGSVPPSEAEAAQIAALLPAILFAFLFNNLVTVYRRRVERSLGDGPATKLEAKPGPMMVGSGGVMVDGR